MVTKKHNRVYYPLTTLFPLLVLLSCNQSPKPVVDIRGLENKSDSFRSFTIYNKGTRQLTILDFTTSCECTAINLKKNDVIDAKDSLKVQVKINPEELDADQMIFVTLKTNANPQLTSFYFRP